MKLRIKGNSLRLRLTKTDVESLIRYGRIEECITFGSSANQKLKYVLELANETAQLAATFENGAIKVQAPNEAALAWSTGEDVNMKGSQHCGTSELNILIEKDFACIAAREGDEDRDAFPHPLQGVVRC